MAPIILSPKDIERFRSRLRRDEATGCLLWIAGKSAAGYGQIGIGGKVLYSHRIAWVLAGNEFTDERPFILHNCPAGDNPACCEPSHLRAGTQAENVTDMARKRRGRGSKIGMPYGVKKARSGFEVQLHFTGVSKYGGLFPTIAEAAIAAEAAREKYFADHPRSS